MEGYTGPVLQGQGRDFGVNHPLVGHGGLRVNWMLSRYFYVGGFFNYGAGGGDAAQAGLSPSVEHSVSLAAAGGSGGEVYGAGSVRVRAGLDAGIEIYSASITNHALFNCDNRSVSTSVAVLAPRVSAEVALDPAHVWSVGAYGTLNVIDPSEYGGGAYLSIASNLFDQLTHPEANPAALASAAPVEAGHVGSDGVDHTPDPAELAPSDPTVAPQQLAPITVTPKRPTQGRSSPSSFAPPADIAPALIDASGT
jgi:hypothetical protein